MRKTYVRQNSISKYYNLLNEVKEKIDKNSIKSLHDLLRKYNVSNDWNTFLKLYNIVYKNKNGFFEWNQSIPVSIKLVEKYRAYKSELNKKYSVNNNQPKLQFDMNYIEIPAEIKAKARAESKTRTTKVKVQQPINIPTQQNEYGLIRKFLKLIWTFLKWLW
jgi:hypothetical protein